MVTRVSRTLRSGAAALLCAGAVLATAGRSAAQPAAEDCRSPRQAEAEALAGDLLDWIAANTVYDVTETRAALPWIAFCAPGDVLSYEGAPVLVDPHLEAAYDAKARTIHLVDPWTPEDPFARSVLLHELIHDVQLLNRDWPCLGAPEWEAYKLQEQWLLEHGIEHDFDWLYIYFTSKCPRDVHP